MNEISARIISLNSMGVSFKATAKRLGISPERVSKKARALGLKPVPRHSNKLNIPTLKNYDTPGPKSGVPLADLGERCCRYPVWSKGKEHLFCGEPSVKWDRPYCEKHSPVVWVKVEAKNG